MARVTAVELSCAGLSVRDLNEALRQLPDGTAVRITEPRGRHNLAVGLTAQLDITIAGNAGYFIGGLGDGPDIEVNGFVGWSTGDNLMSGTIRVRGNASECTGASARGGLIVIEGDASSRTGISLKGGTIAVAGDVGHMSGFMAQAGTILIGGDAADSLGDSLYEAVIYIGGTIKSLGSDARVEDLTDRRRPAGAGARRAGRLLAHLRRGRDPGRVREEPVPFRRAEGPEILKEPEVLVTALAAVAASFSGCLHGLTRAQPGPGINVTRAVDVGVHHAVRRTDNCVLMRSAAPFPALVTIGAGVGRVHQDHASASFFRFADKDASELGPASVEDRLVQPGFGRCAVRQPGARAAGVWFRRGTACHVREPVSFSSPITSHVSISARAVLW